jgi:hypothetical protein
MDFKCSTNAAAITADGVVKTSEAPYTVTIICRLIIFSKIRKESKVNL